MSILPSGLKALHNQLLGAFFDSEYAKECTIVYPKTRTECPNCIPNVNSRASIGQYKTGGPRPFTNGGVCPLCQGRGQLETEVTDTVTALIHYNTQDFVKIGFNINIEEGSIMVEGRNADRDKFVKADTIKIFPEHDGETQVEYIRNSPYIPKGIGKDAFFYCILKRKT